LPGFQNARPVAEVFLLTLDPFTGEIESARSLPGSGGSQSQRVWIKRALAQGVADPDHLVRLFAQIFIGGQIPEPGQYKDRFSRNPAIFLGVAG
jgi:hypothetical protein